MTNKNISFGKEYSVHVLASALRRAHNIPDEWELDINEYSSDYITFSEPRKVAEGVEDSNE